MRPRRQLAAVEEEATVAVAVAAVVVVVATVAVAVGVVAAVMVAEAEVVEEVEGVQVHPAEVGTTLRGARAAKLRMPEVAQLRFTTTRRPTSVRPPLPLTLLTA